MNGDVAIRAQELTRTFGEAVIGPTLAVPALGPSSLVR